MMRIKKALPTLALVAGSLVALAPAQPAAAYDDYGDCWGESCTDLDPAMTNCVDDAVTIWEVAAVLPQHDQEGDGAGVLEMRYSEKCHANWARYSPWRGVDDTIALFLSGTSYDGSPWIWTEGSDLDPRGASGGGQAGLMGEQTKWTSMITADGTTCMSVDVYSYGEGNMSPEMPGSIAFYDEGTYDAGCIS